MSVSTWSKFTRATGAATVVLCLSFASRAAFADDFPEVAPAPTTGLYPSAADGGPPIGEPPRQASPSLQAPLAEPAPATSEPRARPPEPDSTSSRPPVHLVPLPPKAPDETDPNARTTEWAALPVIGGGSDIGVLFGATVVVTRLGDGVRPYLWQLDAIASTSVKSGPRGAEFVQQGWGGRLDVPRIFGSRLRYQFGAFYTRTVNELYFGLGNSAVPDANTVSTGDLAKNQYVNEELRIRNVLRFPIVDEGGRAGPPPGQVNETWTGQVGLQVRALHAQPYSGSALERDFAAKTPSGAPYAYGGGLQGVIVPSVGMLYDTRNREILTSKGSFHELSLRVASVFPDTASTYGGAHLTLRNYTTLPGDIILATRVVVDATAGHVPVFDLSQYGSFTPSAAIGGDDGIRGVPAALYYGRLKALTNIELRRMLFGVHPFGASLEFGLDAFFDAGRVWMNYSFDDPRDGKAAGIKMGAGGGILVLWGQAALFRAEIAYSPDANIANPGFPAAIYLADDVIF